MTVERQYELRRRFGHHGHQYDEQWSVTGTFAEAIAEAQRMARRSQPVEIYDDDDRLLRVVRVA